VTPRRFVGALFTVVMTERPVIGPKDESGSSLWPIIFASPSVAACDIATIG
jgi:hypothetical protein